MRILLVGEYSGFHNSLKHGLQALGHEVTLLAGGDGFKNYPVDVFVGSDFFDRGTWRKRIQMGIFKITGVDLRDSLLWFRFRESVTRQKNYDIIQFINSNPFNCQPATEWKFINSLLENKGTAYLVACGDDFEYSRYLVHEHEGYSILDAVNSSGGNKNVLLGTFKYLRQGYKTNYQKLVKRVEKVIPSNTDYAMALQHQPKANPIIKAPAVLDKFELTQNTDLNIIEIFLGINNSNFWKKGINFFLDALEIVKEKYGDRVKITIARDLPYQEYIRLYDNCHILLDQVLCYDQGYNALEAMLKGKVVFAGGGEEYLKYHNLKKVPVVDAIPDVADLVSKLSYLIEHPNRILELGKQARQHVIEHHDSIKIAQQFVEVYQL
ncbi:MAG: glycosyltransferase [Nonlabens sp.]